MNFNSYSGPMGKTDAMTLEQKNSFHNGYQTVMLPINFILWRFISRQFDRRFGTFWINEETMRDIMQTLHANSIFSQGYKKENVRNGLAILEEWSNLSWRVKIKLVKPAIAFVGETGTQKMFEDFEGEMAFSAGEKIQKVAETRIGRHTQFVIPRFRNLEDINDLAKVEHFVHI